MSNINIDKIKEIVERQREFQKEVGFPIDSVRESDRNEMAEKYLFKAIEEIIELRKEFPSAVNPWSKEQKVADLTRIREEFSDVLLFLINFMIVWRLSPEEILSQLEINQDMNFDYIKKKKATQLAQQEINNTLK